MFNRKPKNRRKQSSVRRWRLPAVNWGRFALPVASFACVFAVISAIAWALDQPIERVSIAGRFQRVSPAEVERAVKHRVRGAGLVSVELEGVRQAVDRLPWVDTVSVQRAWPRGLRVVVTEQVAAARWRENGLLNTRGELFITGARHIPLELPRLSGPEGTETTVARRYLAAQGRLVEAGMRLAALRLDARGAWELDLDNGVTVRLGRKQVDERFDTFIRTALKIVAQRATDIAYIDMRYANGFAVGWRGGNPRPAIDEDDTRDA
jgi:cell division protein FtsQ